MHLTDTYPYGIAQPWIRCSNIEIGNGIEGDMLIRSRCRKRDSPTSPMMFAVPIRYLFVTCLVLCVAGAGIPYLSKFSGRFAVQCDVRGIIGLFCCSCHYFIFFMIFGEGFLLFGIFWQVAATMRLLFGGCCHAKVRWWHNLAAVVLLLMTSAQWLRLFHLVYVHLHILDGCVSCYQSV